MIAARVLGHAASTTRWSDLQPDLRAHALALIVDALAVAVAGARHPEMVKLAAGMKSGAGPCTAFAQDRSVGIRDAIYLNSAGTTVLQYQDGHGRAKGHPASQLVPILLAIAQRDQTSGAAMLDAFVAGYEVAARVGVALGGVPQWLHDIGNWTNIGSAAAAAHLLARGNTEIIAAAVDGAASLGLAFDRFTTVAGATVHHLYAASAATQAFGAAEAAAAGLTSLHGSLERYFGPHFGEGFQVAGLTAGIGTDGRWSEYEIRNGYFKLQPTCAHMHGVNDAIDALIAEEGISADNVETVEVTSFRDAITVDAQEPSTDLAARFSIRAAVAAALTYGRVRDDAFGDLASLRPLMAKIAVRHDPALDHYAPAGRPGSVTVRTRGGNIHTKTVIYPRGTPQTPASASEREAKALLLLGRAYGENGARRIIAAVHALAANGKITALTAELQR